MISQLDSAGQPELSDLADAKFHPLYHSTVAVWKHMSMGLEQLCLVSGLFSVVKALTSSFFLFLSLFLSLSLAG